MLWLLHLLDDFSCLILTTELCVQQRLASPTLGQWAELCVQLRLASPTLRQWAELCVQQKLASSTLVQ